jgi:hypothetical protein
VPRKPSEAVNAVREIVACPRVKFALSVLSYLVEPLWEDRMKKIGVAIIFLSVLSSAANARPPTVGVNPGYDRALQESRKPHQASQARELNIVVKRHRRRK